MVRGTKVKRGRDATPPRDATTGPVAPAPGTRSLNYFALGATIAISQSAPTEVWYYTLVNNQGELSS